MNISGLLIRYCPKLLRPILRRIENSPIGSRLARGVFWSLAGSVISRGLMLCAIILVARILGKTVYGEFGMIRSTIGMFGVFAGFGLGLTATKHVAEFRGSDPERTGRIIGLSAIFAIVTGGLIAVGLFFFSPWIAEHAINAPHLDFELRVGALILFISALNGSQTGALSGFEAFKTIAYVNLFVGMFSFPMLICGTYFGGLRGAVWALAANIGIHWLLNHWALRKTSRKFNVPFTFRNCSQEWSILWKFSLPAVLASSLVGPINWVCSAMLVAQPNGYDEMGLFSAADQWFVLLMFIPSTLGSVALPILSEQLGKNNTKQSIKTMLLAMKVNFFIVIPLVLIGSVASPYIMSIYGEGFVAGWPTLIVVLLTAAIIAVLAPVAQVIAASGKMWSGFVMNLGWALLFIASTLFLVDYGSLGLASARMLSYVVHVIWTVGFVIWLVRLAKRSASPTPENDVTHV